MAKPNKPYTISLSVNPTCIKQFEKHGKEKFPNEAAAFLIGTSKGHSISIEELYYPSISSIKATNSSFEVDYSEEDNAKKYAEELGLKLIGDIHTHPWEFWQLKVNKSLLLGEVAHQPSETDWNDRYGIDWITGITLIREVRRGSFKISTRFWGPTIPIILNKNA